MKRIQLALFYILFSGVVFGQKAPIFTAKVNTDSVLLGNYVQVQFTLENANGENFQPPVFEGFQVVSGPNFSSSVSIVNGNVSQQVSYTFFLEPNDIGNYYIQPASIQVGQDVLETKPLSVIVVPNPDGIIQKTPSPERFNFDWQMPKAAPAPKPKQEAKPPVNKRKTYKL
ncbi:MAG: BatD family protein [Saprospiraceae bacterium]